ncbi:hypothetical protein [Halopiger xanaduensis]|uniref:Uncharacterized protein n=1 Tax=Halopiger xanaduensis (strain DSM 18323 / JCM 14033 / SH-6) TaxID=797210 RepID=F8DBH9_HALXS|nr:hypothetical protein Halxa_2477 [Halopiger xanaduensis SH-6]
MKFCHTCDWFVDETDGATEQDRSRLALEHFVETGHSIDSSESVGRPMPPSICEELLIRDLLGADTDLDMSTSMAGTETETGSGA